MRGVDTNLLVRYLTFDDPEQSPLVQSFFEHAEESGERLFVAAVVLCELAWTLRGPRYRYDQPSIVAALERILQMPLFSIENRGVVVSSVAAYREGRADFADFVIGEAGARAGCSDTVTLDRRLSEHLGFTLLE